jgi:hypothetical protein
MRTRTLLLLPLLALLAACSKTVTWDEEVPLNTGDTIWVKRVVTYKLKGDAGNPFDMAYRPDWTETMKFEWQGKKYSYTGDAYLMLLAISPADKRPVLVANALLKNWDTQHNYRCTTPFYVQFASDELGRNWSWPPAIEPWLYNLPYNLMLHRPKVDEIKTTYTTQDRATLDRITAAQSPYFVSIDPSFRYEQCSK